MGAPIAKSDYNLQRCLCIESPFCKRQSNFYHKSVSGFLYLFCWLNDFWSSGFFTNLALNGHYCIHQPLRMVTPILTCLSYEWLLPYLSAFAMNGHSHIHLLVLALTTPTSTAVNTLHPPQAIVLGTKWLCLNTMRCLKALEYRRLSNQKTAKKKKKKEKKWSASEIRQFLVV